MQSPEREAIMDAGRSGRILIVDDRPASYERMQAMLAGEQSVDVEDDPSEALFHAAEGDYDLLIVSLSFKSFDGLRLCSQVRSLERTRGLPILVIADADNRYAARARARDRRQRLPCASDRQERIAGARTHPGPQEALYRAAARQCAAVDRDGDHRCADWSVQPPLHGEPSHHAGGASRRARQAR